MRELTLSWSYEGDERRSAFPEGTRVRIGRMDSCDFVMPASDRTIHREHVEVYWDGGHALIRNLGSNAVRLQSRAGPLQRGDVARLADDDRLQIGQVTVRAALATVQREATARQLRCHNCGRLQDYRPEGMCIQCGFALAGAETVVMQPRSRKRRPKA